MKNKFLITGFFIVNFSFNNIAQSTLFTLLPYDSTGINFYNQIADTRMMNVMSYEYFYNGGGVAIGDINNDGLADIYFSANTESCKLYLNQGNLKFKDITEQAGVSAAGGYHTGVVMVDINNDGWLDIYICQSVLQLEHRKNILFENNKNGTFTDKATDYGIADKGFSTQAYFNDSDNDGDLDLLVLNHPYKIQYAKSVHLAYNAQGKLEAVKDSIVAEESNQFYENINGKFINKTSEAGLETHSFGLSAVFQDFNNDGLADIYQANDYTKPDYLFINKGNNKFVNEFSKFFGHSPYFSMGTEYADLNNDGLSDLIAVDMLPEGNERQKQLKGGYNYDEFDKLVKYGFGYQYVKNVVQLNNGNGTYSDISYYSGMAFSDWSWAVLAADFDIDGLKDVYITNGYMRDATDMDFIKFKADSLFKELYKAKSDSDVVKIVAQTPQTKVLNCYFKNNDSLNFKREIKKSGLTHFAWSHGAAYGDLDNDGDLEIIVNNTNDYAFIYKNNSIENKLGNSMRIQLNGDIKNPMGIGTKIVCETNSGTAQTLIFNPMKGYLSSHDKKIIIGIGNNTSANLTFTWPNGKIQKLFNALPNQLININYSQATDTESAPIKFDPLFIDVTNSTLINYHYTENQHIDFKLEPLLPHRFSQLGPCISVADFNADQLDDFFVGGAKDFSATIYFQNSNHTFSESKQLIFQQHKIYEDGASAVTDFDHDGDNDLIVASGGNEYPGAADKYPLRLYLNDGKGNFSNSKLSSKFFLSASSIAVSDFNKDGNTDIFVGGRIIPGHYGLIPESYLLSIINDSLVNINISTVLSKIGMVSTAIWSDINKDSWLDLVLTGEWMPIVIFYNIKGVLSKSPQIIENSNGWWNKIIGSDIDMDGDMDLIAGNLGTNTRYRGTINNPVTMVAGDFDNNKSTDCMISTFVKGKSYPIAIRDDVLEQMPYLRKKYLRYKD